MYTIQQTDYTHTHTHTRLTALFPGLPKWASTRNVKPIWILLKQETVSGSGTSWTICKSAPRFRQITTPAPHHSVFTGRMPFLSPNQQRQSTEGITNWLETQKLYTQLVMAGAPSLQLLAPPKQQQQLQTNARDFTTDEQLLGWPTMAKKKNWGLIYQISYDLS